MEPSSVIYISMEPPWTFIHYLYHGLVEYHVIHVHFTSSTHHQAYRQTPPRISDSQKGVVVLITNVSCAPCQLRPATIFTMVIGQGSIINHGRNVRKHTLQNKMNLNQTCLCDAQNSYPKYFEICMHTESILIWD